MKMTTAQFEEHQDDNAGYCTHCDQITTSDVEPDAEGYDCPECHNQTVMGLDNALVLEHVEITDEEDPDDEEDEDEEEEEDYEGGSFL